MELVSCGHLGTFIEKIDYEKLQECCLTQGLMGIMPLPYSLIYEGMATAMYEQLKDLRFNMAYVRGAIGRIELVESGAYHFAIGSQFAVEHEIQCGREIEAVFNFGWAVICQNMFYSYGITVRTELQRACVWHMTVNH